MHNLVTLTILSFDPFGMGEMWYEAKTVLNSHPEYPYDDGIRRVFLYASGRINHEQLEAAGIHNGESIRDMLRYICASTKDHVTNESIEKVDGLPATAGS